MKRPTVYPKHLVIWVAALACLLRQATSAYVSHVCTNSSTLLFPNTTYYSNLNVLFSHLVSNATKPGGFYRTTVASATPDQTVGFIICRGDLSPEICSGCAANATADALRLCPLEKRGLVWYDECWLRYEESQFNPFATVPAITPSSTANVTGNETGRFSEVLVATMRTVVSEAVNSATRFATEEAAVTGSTTTLYSLAQCTPDMSARDCDTCLKSAVAFYPSCCGGKRGGRALLPSCVARFEVYPFYNITAKESITPPLPPSGAEKGNNHTIILAILVPIGVVFVALVISFLVIRRKMLKKRYLSIRRDSTREDISMGGDNLQFSMEEIEIATENFSEANKIGEGGFGEVFLGTLPDGQKIAVKKLLRASGQGEEQFKNEAVLVAKLQHRNLVRLLGFCLERQKKILVYEFVPNKSLDYFIFNEEKKSLLDWTRRYKIIGGIARGILYLHEDSRLKIIHRDLKASNILLDDHMNPKIADFGMAKVFITDQTHGTTSRIAGTFGYMSPEYAMHGQFSVKSDVFSYGVLVLEILSGKKNNSFYQSNFDGDLLSIAWEQWKNGTPLEFLDPTIRHSVSRNEAIRCIHMGLLCVQENPAVRPTMPTIVLMLNSYSVTLALPQHPAVLHRNRTPARTPVRVNEPSTGSTNNTNVPMSVNDESMITEVYPR